MVLSMPMLGESIRIIKKSGISVVGSRAAANEKELVRAAKSMGYPLVMKADVPSSVHKTDKGFVVIGISDEKQLKKAYKKMRKKRVLLQKMIKGENCDREISKLSKREWNELMESFGFKEKIL